ncbi:MAG TPA: DNA ligase, partial [Luteimonas sp.]
MTPRFARLLFSQFLPLLLLLPACALPLHAAEASPPRLMLATGYQDDVDASRYWVSEKLDGVRGRWDGHALWTRGGHRVHAPAWFTEGWPPVPMDGELWLGRGRFEDTSGTVRAGDANDPAWRRMRFMVFDLPGDPGTFT